jgi:hypothetical protein
MGVMVKITVNKGIVSPQRTVCIAVLMLWTMSEPGFTAHRNAPTGMNAMQQINSRASDSSYPNSHGSNRANKTVLFPVDSDTRNGPPEEGSRRNNRGNQETSPDPRQVYLVSLDGRVFTPPPEFPLPVEMEDGIYFKVRDPQDVEMHMEELQLHVRNRNNDSQFGYNQRNSGNYSQQGSQVNQGQYSSNGADRVFGGPGDRQQRDQGSNQFDQQGDRPQMGQRSSPGDQQGYNYRLGAAPGSPDFQRNPGMRSNDGSFSPTGESSRQSGRMAGEIQPNGRLALQGPGYANGETGSRKQLTLKCEVVE